MQVKLATWNIHGCIGTDGIFNPERVSNVINQLDADIIALQEVESFTDGGGNILYAFETHTDFVTIAGHTMYRRDSSYGNAVLTRQRPVSVAKSDISLPGREPRGVISLLYDFDGTLVHVMATHLGLRSGERQSQLESILAIMQRQPADITVLMGDMNEWLPWGKAARWLGRQFGGKSNPATFPSYFPLLSLDQIRVLPDHCLKEPRIMVTALSRAASDHLPLTAEMMI